jgi:hypothetical protein
VRNSKTTDVNAASNVWRHSIFALKTKSSKNILLDFFNFLTKN